MPRLSPARPAAPDLPPDAVARARAGDAAAFEAVYRAHAGRVYALCLRMSGDRARAEELTQDVFVRAWERLALYRGESAFGTWLHRLAVNVVLEDARRVRRREARVRAEGDEPMDRAASPAGLCAEERITLEQAVAALPPGARRAFVLHDVHGYKHDEIARLTGLAPGTLRAQLHRARQLLIEALR